MGVGVLGLETLAGRGSGEANCRGAGAEVLWEGPNRREPGCLRAERPAPHRRGGGETGVLLAAPPFCS